MDYILLEKIIIEKIKQEESFKIYAVPVNAFKKSAEIGELIKITLDGGGDVYVVRGNMVNVSKKDFSHDTFFSKGVAPIISLMELNTVPNNDQIIQGLEQLANSYNVDRKTDWFKLVQNQLLDQVLLSGDIYGVRTLSKDQTKTAFAFVDRGEKLSLEKNSLIYKGAPIEKFDEGQVDDFIKQNEAVVFYAGVGSFTLKALKPFYSKGKYGGLHANSRVIDPVNKTSVKKITFLNKLNLNK